MKILISFLLLSFSLSIYAAPPVPPGNLSDVALRSWLKHNWYVGKHHDLGYNGARRFMYNAIDKDTEGNVTGVYTGFTQPGRDTSFLNPINAEHTIPQSWFNKKPPMKSDIHHLFPTHKDVNSARGSLPFDEIDDNLTDNWYVKGGSGIVKSRDIPSTNIDSYSERGVNKSFEPREDHKGNLARAIYYFYTMYPSAAGDISKIADKDILFQWHIDDPVDASEITRNDRIEARQGNRNPYIDHPNLVAKAWGGDIPIDNDDSDNSDNPAITNSIEVLKSEISVMEAALVKLKAELEKLEDNLN